MSYSILRSYQTPINLSSVEFYSKLGAHGWANPDLQSVEIVFDNKESAFWYWIVYG